MTSEGKAIEPLPLLVLTLKDGKPQAHVASPAELARAVVGLDEQQRREFTKAVHENPVQGWSFDEVIAGDLLRAQAAAKEYGFDGDDALDGIIHCLGHERRDLRAELERLRNSAEWRTEGHPEYLKTVLVTAMEDDGAGIFVCPAKHGRLGWRYMNGVGILEVLAWRELPEGYRAEEKGKTP